MNEQKPLFSVSNHHSASVGQPPVVDGDTPNRYHGYFENKHGDQFVFVYDFNTGEATLRGGDMDWGQSYRVVDGEVADTVLSEQERAWLRACWEASDHVYRWHREYEG